MTKDKMTESRMTKERTEWLLLFRLWKKFQSFRALMISASSHFGNSHCVSDPLTAKYTCFLVEFHRVTIWLIGDFFRKKGFLFNRPACDLLDNETSPRMILFNVSQHKQLRMFFTQKTFSRLGTHLPGTGFVKSFKHSKIYLSARRVQPNIIPNFEIGPPSFVVVVGINEVTKRGKSISNADTRPAPTSVFLQSLCCSTMIN